jgi:Divergent 4Fe-4S mono-cluster
METPNAVGHGLSYFSFWYFDVELHERINHLISTSTDFAQDMVIRSKNPKQEGAAVHSRSRGSIYSVWPCAAGACVRGLPSVFNVSKKPWIDDITAWTPPVVAKGFLLRHCSKQFRSYLCGARVAALASTPHGQGLDLVSI